MEGAEIDFSPYNEAQALLATYGSMRELNGKVAMSNRVFEAPPYDYFLAEEQGGTLRDEAIFARSTFVEGGRLNMRAVLEGLRRAYTEVCGPLGEGGRLRERGGREPFPMCLEPVINGTGNYHIEARTRGQTRAGAVVDHGGERFVVEPKVRRGPRYSEAGGRRVADHLDHFGLDVGHMLSFNFNKRKEPGLKRVAVGKKVLFEETV